MRGRDRVVGDGQYLRISEVIARLRAAGFPDSESTVRRLADSGELVYYRSGMTGHRRITAASVDALISRRRDAGGDAGASSDGAQP